ncbi:MAG TPA: 2-oxoglutarate dehydrogenase, E2 component, dihydrolipoamide succinyltransferase [Gemmatimonadaceae bacterium]|nr:2-oxoglutarate dehydrogenase, E2 component, dihydrolipoamide succinyltransferase [Gemmatimonadaceae bacterium]
MARVDVIMPQMGESIAEGTLSRWLKKVGDEVKRDEPIFEISTDKVDAEIPAPAAGVIAEIIVTEGQTVAVQTVVARIETEKGAAIAPAASAPTPAAAAPAGAAAGPASAPAAGAGRGAPPAVESNGGATAPLHRPAAPATASAPAANSFEERVRTKSSPLVRKIAAEHGIELTAVAGSGIAGRVTKRDIEAFLQSGPAVRAPAPGRVGAGVPSMHAPGGVDAHAPVVQPWPGDTVEPMSKMRALISEHMVASRRTAAHVTSFFEADFTRIARVRAKRRAEFEAATGQKLTYLPFLIKAVVDGLRAFPALNASVAGTSIIYRKAINIGVAVALDWGLIVPVIRNADELSLAGLTRALNDLAARARAKKLQPHEVQEGTFTITNPGVFGSLMGTPIINQPQVAILGIGAIEKRPKVVTGADGEDTIAIRTCAYLSLSFDHRIIDGAVADEFLASVKRGVETFPESGF